MRQIEITKDTAGQRLDKFLARHLSAAPKSFIQKMLRKKNITVNGRRADNSYITAADDIVTLFFSDETIAKFTKPSIAHDGEVDIVFEDENIVVANKPTNLLTQPDEAGGDSLLGRLRHNLDTGQFAPVAINRLDRNTTGLVLFAKNLPAAQILSRQIHDRAVSKIYAAIAHGEIVAPVRLDGFHVKDAEKNIARVVAKNVPRGTFLRETVTDIISVKYNAVYDVSVLEIALETGRSHQIRAHLAGIGHPLAGDKKYGGRGERRQMLHAKELILGEMDGALQYLSGKSFAAPLPGDMMKYYP